MRILITGASGLVGGRLMQSLRELPEVQIRAGSRRERSWPDGVEGVVTDLDRPQSLLDACRDMDAVINLASMGEQPARLEPLAALRVNAGGTFALASSAAAVNVSRFVQLSTFKVYGQNPSGIISEDTACHPRSHYAVTHHCAEEYAMWQHPRCVVFRLANGFGAPATADAECWDIIVNEMCRQAVVVRQITLRSSGQGWRSFIPLQDIVRALVGGVSDLSPGIYNLGAAKSMRIVDMAERVARVCRDMLGFSPHVRVGEPDQVPDLPLEYRIDKLMSAGYGPTASIDDEIAGTLMAAHARWAPLSMQQLGESI